MALGLPKVWSCCKLGGKSRIGYRENLHMTPLLFPPDFPWNKNVQLLKSESVNHRFDDPWSYWMVSKKCIQASWNIPRIDVLPFFLAEDSVGKSSTCFFYVFFFFNEAFLLSFPFTTLFDVTNDSPRFQGKSVKWHISEHHKAVLLKLWQDTRYPSWKVEQNSPFFTQGKYHMIFIEIYLMIEYGR